VSFCIFNIFAAIVAESCLTRKVADGKILLACKGNYMCRSGGIGRRSRLKICRQRWRAGSSPAFGTIENQGFQTIFVGSLFLICEGSLPSIEAKMKRTASCSAI
jgi:hypothetical protein